MGRPRSFDNVVALENAMGVFWSKGYEATSLGDLELAMGLLRTSIYNAFGNKRRLFIAALQHYSHQTLRDWTKVMDDNHDPKSAIRSILYAALDLHFAPHTPGGCLIGLTVMESEQHDEETLQIVATFFRRLNRSVERYLKRAKARGALSPTFDDKALAAVVSSMMPGLILRARAQASKAVLNRAIDGVVRLI